MFRVSIGTTLTGAEIVFLPYAQSTEEIAHAFQDFSELDLFDAMMAMEYLFLAAMRGVDIERMWRKPLNEHLAFLSSQISKDIIMDFKLALDLFDAFKARDYGKQRVFEKYRTL